MILRLLEILTETNKGNIFEQVFETIRKLIGYSFMGIIMVTVITLFTPHREGFQVLLKLLSIAWHYIINWGDWVFIIVLISLGLALKPTTFYNKAEEIRLNMFWLETARWERTPYIAPLHLYYLLAVPNSYSPYIKDISKNKFYQIVMNQFRSRVYTNTGHSSLEPSRKPSRLKIIGIKSFFPIIAGIGLEVLFFYSLYDTKPINKWFTGLERFLIPVVVFIASWVIQQILAIIIFSNPRKLRKAIENMFDEPEPKIPWREAFPDKKLGQMIIQSWQYHVDLKQRALYKYLNIPYPVDNKWEYEDKTIAPYPFPSEQIPEWADEIEQVYFNSVDQWREEQLQTVNKQVKVTKDKSKGKVVKFTKRKLKI
ncbi:hypothetical protein [Tepidibacillus fermentans]|uniref:Uncharacterized protein n=1 Tax=Tepidibacillus fermentans TaxID=1281767 RepID=A0A4R3KKY4_9BACI|nr:hypothetical protein [Tepidibacillus fermentans]TCS84555.1 hypothetical protein EDD72_101224 [Tepidibacillus fermentans]